MHPVNMCSSRVVDTGIRGGDNSTATVSHRPTSFVAQIGAAARVRVRATVQQELVPCQHCIWTSNPRKPAQTCHEGGCKRRPKMGFDGPKIGAKQADVLAFCALLQAIGGLRSPLKIRILIKLKSSHLQLVREVSALR